MHSPKPKGEGKGQGKGFVIYEPADIQILGATTLKAYPTQYPYFRKQPIGL